MEPKEGHCPQQADDKPQGRRTFSPCAFSYNGNIVIAVFVALYFFLIPAGIAVYYLSDPALKQDGTPRFARRVHRWLSPRYETWATKRVASGRAARLDRDNISGTEWPMFGSTFYLWAAEAIQDDWDKKGASDKGPQTYAAGAIKAAARLIADPGHAAWVRMHWGDDYLHEENVFYRYLLIGGLSSYQKLSGDRQYEPLLRDQIDTLSSEIDASPYGILDDYPDQCYPTDVMAAIAAIQQADGVLGTDHSFFIRRSIRGFSGEMVDHETGLPPYFADAFAGKPYQSQGCSSQWAAVWAAYLWPDYAKVLYGNFETYFWQVRKGFAGFREFPKGKPSPDWFIHVDAGPIVDGFGTAACAFGIGAARANGRFDHAYPLAAEAIVFSWPLPDGRLATPRLLANLTDAPYIGETALLFAFTREPAAGMNITSGGRLPPAVIIALGLYLLAGLILVGWAFFCRRRWRKNKGRYYFPEEPLQFFIWLFCVVVGVYFLFSIYMPLGMMIIVFTQFLPVAFKKKTKSV